MRTIVFVLAASVALSTTVQSASFDCSEASSEAERIIRSDDLISHADDLLNDVYLKALYASKQPHKLRAEQSMWLRTKRDACREISCLRAEYASRTAALEALAAGVAPSGALSPFRYLNTYGGTFPWDVLKDKALR